MTRAARKAGSSSFACTMFTTSYGSSSPTCDRVVTTSTVTDHENVSRRRPGPDRGRLAVRRRSPPLTTTTGIGVGKIVVGFDVGEALGTIEGAAVGSCDGENVGVGVGRWVGLKGNATKVEISLYKPTSSSSGTLKNDDTMTLPSNVKL